jgi:hypothetical protein
MVLPADFYQRFTAPEQTFVFAHESLHIIRRDPLANFIVAIIRSLFWFHPLVHLAVRYFRIDQEFACDADVLGIHAQDRYHYASAILKGQISTPALPAGCHLDSYTAASLKRRFLMLQASLPSRRRRLLGATMIGISTLVSGGLAWAQAPVKPANSRSSVADTIITTRPDGAIDTLVRKDLITTTTGPRRRLITRPDGTIDTLVRKDLITTTKRRITRPDSTIDTLVRKDLITTTTGPRRRLITRPDGTIDTITASDSVKQVAPTKP